MSDVDALLERLSFSGPLPVGARTEPLGRAWLADERWGVDLDAAAYVEQEFLLTGQAYGWRWTDDLVAERTELGPFTTRVVARRPEDPARFSGLVQLEPHHPSSDRALSWESLGPWIVRAGHAHVGVTQDPWVVPDVIAWDPERYGRLVISDPTHRWDIVSQVCVSIRSGALPSFADLAVERIVMSGWSMTGTFCRTFLGEGFHERAQHQGRPAVSGYVICISSGNARRAGYNELVPEALPADDPRRTIQPHGAPVVELLSECESETHGPVLRPDSDAAEDPYRLYQVAGTGHSTTQRQELSTNFRQMARRGLPQDACSIVETPSDGRMDLVARAVFAAVDRWIADGTPPPRAGRFAFADPGGDGHRGRMPESVALARDADRNVLGGIRTPWVEVPAATYLPHSTPRLGACETTGTRLPGFGPLERADLIAHMVPFSAEQMACRYGTREGYAIALRRAVASVVKAGWLLSADVDELVAGRPPQESF